MNTISIALQVLSLSSTILVAQARTFTVTNSCPFTIWPAIFTDLTIATNVPDQPTGWEAPAGSSVSFSVPDDWKAGRIWGRRNCDFSVNPGPNSCLTGGCNGGLLCDNATGTGVPPVTVAEWTLQGDQNLDYYDVSLVDGSDLPMSITTSVGCPEPGCPVDLGPSCPDQLKGPFDSTGFPLGCKSACFANLDGNQANSPNCCSGQFDTPATCPSSGVAFYSYFKGNCPDAYAYAFDESSNTALWTCDSSKLADYTLTFCPPATVNAAASPSLASSVSSVSGAFGSVSGDGTGTATVLPSSVTSASVVVANALSMRLGRQGNVVGVIGLGGMAFGLVCATGLL